MSSHRSENPPPKPAPRNYLGRREQLRLLMLVGSLMLVIIVMNEARKPENWVWLERLADESAAGDAGGEIDTRLQFTGSDGSDVEQMPGAIVAPTFRFKTDGNLDDVELAYRRAETTFWIQQMELLDWRDRRRLPQVLKAVRDGKPLPQDDAQAWLETVEQLDERWQEYTEKAMGSVTVDPQLSDEDRGAWLMILQRLHQHWNDETREALKTAVEPSSLSDAQRRELQRFQKLFDEMSINAIRDGTVVARPKETNAWFRLFEHLQHTPQASLESVDAPDVTFRQIFQQPDEYRGQLIRLRGEAKRAYHLQAPKNLAGIEGYYKFIVAPAGHPDNPVFVYALDVPDDFPEVKDLNIDKGVTDLTNVDVDFVGYFFKLVAYQSGDGPRVAPLILAKVPTWEPQLPPGDPEPPNLLLLAVAVIGTGLLGTAIAAFIVSRHGATPSQQFAPSAQAKPQHFAALAEEDLSGTPEKRIEQLQSENPETDRAEDQA